MNRQKDLSTQEQEHEREIDDVKECGFCDIGLNPNDYIQVKRVYALADKMYVDKTSIERAIKEMKMFTDCSGECAVCGAGGGCVAGHGDDEYYRASQSQLLERLDKNQYPAYRELIKKKLKEWYNAVYLENEPKEQTVCCDTRNSAENSYAAKKISSNYNTIHVSGYEPFNSYMQGDKNMSGVPNQDIKADAGKPRLSLVPTQILNDIAFVRAFGVNKYGKTESWKQVEPERYRDAAFRHMIAYINDSKSVDEESGLPHLWHLACNIAFLCELEKE